MLPTRDDALNLMHEHTKNENLRRHMYAVEAAMRAYARQFDEDEDFWGLTGLIHDFDYERWPNSGHKPDEEHPSTGVRILEEKGYPEQMRQAILGHAEYTGVLRDSLVAKALYAVDELTAEKDPEKIERDLMPLVPRGGWIDFGLRLIQHGRYTCRARSPKCDVCPVEDLCPSAGTFD